MVHASHAQITKDNKMNLLLGMERNVVQILAMRDKSFYKLVNVNNVLHSLKFPRMENNVKLINVLKYKY